MCELCKSILYLDKENCYLFLSLTAPRLWRSLKAWLAARSREDAEVAVSRGAVVIVVSLFSAV